MGTNFYLEMPRCPTCCHQPPDWHIGKRSGGWAFALHVDEACCNLERWDAAMRMPGTTIKDEYGQTLTVDEMLHIIRTHGAGERHATITPLLRGGAAPTWPTPPGVLYEHVEGEFS